MAYLAGDYHTAVEHYDAALERRGDLAIAHLNRGYSYLALFRLSHDPELRRELADETVRSFNAYLEAPHSDRPQGGATRDRLEDHILNMYLGTGQRERAVALLRARLDANPTDLATIHTMIGLCEELADIREGARWLRRLVELEPDNPEAYYRLGVFVWKVSYYGQLPAAGELETLVDEGLAALSTAVEIDPEHAAALTYINLLYREKAKRAHEPHEREQFERQADEYFSRAMALREMT